MMLQQQSPPLPLLRLALERIASSRHSIAKIADVMRAEQVSADQWRWTVQACMFPLGTSRGICLDLVIETDFASDSSTPPTQWPYRILSESRVPGPPPSTDQLLLLRGR